MLDTHSLSLSLPSSPSSTTTSCSLSRTALADSTNVNPYTIVCAPGCSKSIVYPTSSSRTSCGWNDFECGSASISVQSRHHYLSFTPSPFLVTYKAPPTVSISLSAACSQNIPGKRLRGLRVQGLEPDLPDVKSVVPFPSTPLDGDVDVEMLDGTCSDSHLRSVGLAPRKRHSAQSSVSSSHGNPGKDVKPKRQRKSKRQVAELWWLGVVHRSILRGIEARQSNRQLDSSDRILSGPRDLDGMDRLLAEKIQRRLADNGCVEGRTPLNPLPRISSPRISGPSLNLVAPSRKTLSTGSASFALSSDRDPKESDVLDGVVASQPVHTPSPSASPSLTSRSHPSILPDTHTSRHVHFDTQQRPRQRPLRSSVPRRSPSPPARTGAVSTNAQMLTFTIPQLVASLVLAHHERDGLRLRGRSSKVVESTKNAGRSTHSVPSGGASYDKETMHQLSTLRARLTNAPEKKSPLSRVLYTES